MKRRSFFRQVFGALGFAAAGPGIAEVGSTVVIQSSPIAGFQFHEGAAVWSSLRVGAQLTLQREPENTHDRNAVAVYFGGAKVGYIPAAENLALAQMLDRGEVLEARISNLAETDDPWQRVEVTVSLA